MAIAAAREIHDGDVVFVGVGLPNLAVNLARRTHAPGAQLVYESGVFGARPLRQPLSIGDPSLATGALSIMPMTDTFSYFLQGGRIDVGFLGAAQIDRYGNLNTTVIGDDYDHPEVRLPGAGGATEISWLAKRTVILLPQTRAKFPERLDFRTSVGHHEGGTSRRALGSDEKGPSRVITNLGVYGFDDETKEMELEALHPGVTFEEVEGELGWKIRVRRPLASTEAPPPDTLRLLRDELDPMGVYLG